MDRGWASAAKNLRSLPARDTFTYPAERVMSLGFRWTMGWDRPWTGIAKA